MIGPYWSDFKSREIAHTINPWGCHATDTITHIELAVIGPALLLMGQEKDEIIATAKQASRSPPSPPSLPANRRGVRTSAWSAREGNVVSQKCLFIG